ERVLDRHQRALARPLVHGHDRVVDGGKRLQDVAVPAGVHHGLVGERALGPQIADVHQPDGGAGPGACAAPSPPPSARCTASVSSGESSSSASPSRTCLAYRRACSRWWIEDSTTPERRWSSSAIEVDWRPDISL